MTIPPYWPPPVDYASAPTGPRVGRGLFGWRRGLLGWLLFIALAVMLVMLVQNPGHAGPNGAITVDQFATKLEEDAVQDVTVDGDVLTGRFVSPQSVGGAPARSTYRVDLPAGGGASLLPWLLDNRRGARIETGAGGSNPITNILVPMIPWLLIFGFIWFFVFRQLRQQRLMRQQPTPVVIVNPPGPPPYPGGPAPREGQ